MNHATNALAPFGARPLDSYPQRLRRLVTERIDSAPSEGCSPSSGCGEGRPIRSSRRGEREIARKDDTVRYTAEGIEAEIARGEDRTRRDFKRAFRGLAPSRPRAPSACGRSPDSC